MKKLFSILTVILFVGNIWAAEKTDIYVFNSKSWTATLNGDPANWTSGKDGAGFSNNGVQVTVSATGANATSPVSFDNITKIVVTYNTNAKAGAGTMDVKIGDNDAVNKPWAKGDGNGTTGNYTVQYDYATPQSGAVKLTVNCTTNSAYIVKIAITSSYESADPLISAEKVDLGAALIGIEDAGFALDTAITVEGANLSAPIAVSFIGSHLSATESELPAAGGTLNLHIASDAAIQLADTILLTSGETVAKVPVVAKIKQNIALPGTPALITGVTKSTSATIDGISGVKVGTGDADGSLTITVPAKAIKLRFYAAAWTGAPGQIALSAPAGITLGADNLDVLADNGITGNPPYVLEALTPTPFKQEITLSGVTEETVITLSSATARRFAVWDAKCDIDDTPEPEPITDYTIHYLAKDDSELSNEVVTLNLPEAPAVTGFTFLYWRAVAGGNIADEGIKLQAVYEVDVPMSAPDVVVNPSNPAQKLIREGNVYILRDNRTFTTSGTLVR